MPESPRQSQDERIREVQPELREVDLTELLRGCDRIVIRHGKERYVLRLTRQNRLLLTK